MQLRRRQSASTTRIRSTGQGLLEFALILPVILVLVIGALDLGMAFHVKVVLENSAREGAYYMVYNLDRADVPGSVNQAIAAVQAEAENSGVEIAAADVTVECLVGGVVNPGCPIGSTVSVTAAHDTELLVDVFFDGPLTLTNRARMMIP
jgi:Flp pilus assembly protein TadG